MYPYKTEGQRNRPLLDRYFGALERLTTSDSLLMKIAIMAFFVSFVWFIANLSLGWRTNVAVHGGTLHEGIVGTPRFINPVLAVTRADKDLSMLVFDSIMTLGKDGTLVPSAAESVTISEDKLTYNVILRKGIEFHDGTPLTALDVVFTVNKITDPMIASPLRSGFSDVTVEQVGEYELNFILPEPYAPFIENLTFGILPQHIWKDVTNEEFPFTQKNSEPIGSGPYTVRNIDRNASGIPEVYILKSNDFYFRGTPKIETLVLSFFTGEEKLIEAFNEGNIDSFAGASKPNIANIDQQSSAHSVIHIPLPRTFSLFFNQNKSTALREKGVREALSTALDRGEITKNVLGEFGIPLFGPLPVGFGVDTAIDTDTPGDKSEHARDILEDSGWKFNIEKEVWEKKIDGTLTPLEITITTANTPLFETTAEIIRTAWEQIGIPVSIKQFEQSDLTQSVIRPRDYEALLFGTQLGRSLDYYSFWHSSQRNDPGLNVALYTNITTDSLLTEARTHTDIAKRNDALMRFGEEIKKETPALFLYQPELPYILPKNIIGVSFQGIGEPHERFASVHDWYIDTESIWSFLAPKDI